MIVTLTMNPSVDRTVALDELTLGATNRVREARVNGSGKGINVSLALKKLGISSAAAGILAGREGQFVEDTVRSAGITPYFTWLKQGATRVNTKVFESKHNRTTEINEPGPQVGAEDEAALWRDLKAVVPGADYLICAGSLPPGVEPGFYRRLTSWCRERGVKVCLDASGKALMEGVRAQPFMIKPNEDEVEQLLGWRPAGKEQMLTAVQRLAGLGPEIVIVSLGGEGAVFYRRGEDVLWARARAEPLASTAGCGDALVAGVISSLLAGRTWEELVCWSVAVATATAEIFGTEFPTVHHVQRALERVIIEKLNSVR